MPRPNPLRSIQREHHLADRIAYERGIRGWTYESTAKRLTDVGCPIQASAVYKIEKGTPRRRISVDELVAFATIFGAEVAELLLPVEVVADRAALAMLQQLDAAKVELILAVNRVAEVVGAYQRLRALGGDHLPDPDLLLLTGAQDDPVTTAENNLVRTILEADRGEHQTEA